MADESHALPRDQGDDAGPLTILVLVKQVPDVNAVKIDRSSGKPILGGQQVVSSYDAHAIEAALQLRDQFGGEVVVVTAGPASAKDAISRALAMGADRGIQITLDIANAVDSLATARLLADAVRESGFDLILAGQTADDYETGQVGPQVAELLELPLVSSVIGLELDGNRIMATRDMEDGHQTVETGLPAVLLISSGLNQPRYPSLKGIMGAKKKPVEQVAAGAPANSAADRMRWGEPYVPERTVTGTILQDQPAADAAKQLVAWLQDQKII
ncbi:MAG: electron transfer flavoprotein subunit beta/FixA family protein [Chloroflexota bacterium]|nr:electron transfer flavoprotein subunit beta/FixA family protein [Chloroflexota bacterium]